MNSRPDRRIDWLGLSIGIAGLLFVVVIIIVVPRPLTFWRVACTTRLVCLMLALILGPLSAWQPLTVHILGSLTAAGVVLIYLISVDDPTTREAWAQLFRRAHLKWSQMPIRFW